VVGAQWRVVFGRGGVSWRAGTSAVESSRGWALFIVAVGR
jgi:hypothetical protein